MDDIKMPEGIIQKMCNRKKGRLNTDPLSWRLAVLLKKIVFFSFGFFGSFF
jgi:hypothetical protein